MPTGVYTRTKEHKEALTGIKRSEETRQNMRLAALKRKERGTQPSGYKLTKEQRLRRKGIRAGEANNLWRGGVSRKNKSERLLAMETVEYKLWRETVFERDAYTCQECNQLGGKLNADHIKSWANYPELRYDVSNGRTLCVECHKKTPNYGNRKSEVILKEDGNNKEN